jgi:hypothetical protein
MYSWRGLLSLLSTSWVFGDTSLTDNGNSSHAFILFIGVVWGLSTPDIHDEKFYICLMCGYFSVSALFFLFIKQASILSAKAEWGIPRYSYRI